MKQRLQYYFLFVVLRIVFKLPQYRAYAYLANESVQALQAKKDRIAELRRLDRQYSAYFTQLDFFGVTGLLPGHEEEMIEKLIKPAFMVSEELKKIGIKEDIIEILLYYYQLKDTYSR